MRESITIAKKEFTEILRDKASILLMIIPIFVFPLFNLFTTQIAEAEMPEINVSVYAQDEYIREKIIRTLNASSEKINVFEIENNENTLRNKVFDFCVIAENNEINFVCDFTSLKSFLLTTQIGEKFQNLYYEQIKSKNDDFYVVNLKNTDGKNFDVASISTLILPTLIIMIVCQGSTTLANNSFAGEKERKTFEMLLLSGAKRSNIYLGKCISLFVITIINFILSMLSYIITNYADGSILSMDYLTKGNMIVNIMFIVVTLLLLNIMSVIISVTVSMVSDNFKNSQLINEMILGIPLLLSVVVSFDILDFKSKMINYIPILNIVACFCDAFRGEPDINCFLVSIIETLILIISVFIFSKNYIESDKIVE